MSDIRRVNYDKQRDLWVYEDNDEPATLADTMASLRQRNLTGNPRRTAQWGPECNYCPRCDGPGPRPSGDKCPVCGCPTPKQQTTT